MAIFEYKAVTSAGRVMSGTVEADSPEDAEATLRGMALSVRSVARAAPPKPRTPIGRSEFILFNQQLASIARAGIPLERSLRELAGEVGSRRMRGLIEGIADDLEAGKGIEEAFAARRRHFPPLYGRIVSAGVQTGRLGEMLTSLNRHLEVAGQTRRIVWEAVSYPLVVLALAAVVMTVLFRWIAPRFGAIFDAFDAELPGITRLCLSMSHHVLAFWGSVVGLILVGVFARLLLRTFPAGRRFTEALFMGLPVLGRIYRATVLARLAEAMATLISAGTDMPACLRLGADATGSETLRAEAEDLARGVEAGQDLGELIRPGKVIPGMFLYSMRLGAQRNELADNLHGLAEMYAGQARANQGRLHGALMPLLLIVVGAIVALMVTAMFLPLTSLIGTMQGR